MRYEEQFTLPVIPPFRLDLTVWALRRRQKNLIDLWDGKQYKRVFVIKENVLQVIVTQISLKELSVIIKSDRNIEAMRPFITKLIQKVLGTDRNLEDFYNLAQKDKHLKLLVQNFKGMKPPRFPTLFEALVNSIACQQITLDVGILLLNRLSQNYGKKISDNGVLQNAFPRPIDLYKISEDEIKKLGFSYQKARALIGLSQSLVNKKLLLTDLMMASNEEIVASLSQIRGIGRWSAEYALLRGLGKIDVFPGDDVGAQKNLMQLLNLSKRPNYDQVYQLTKTWEPYAGFVYFHLLLEKLKAKNLL
jgi:DNA-3-methyladenine glycosylase II